MDRGIYGEGVRKTSRGYGGVSASCRAISALF